MKGEKYASGGMVCVRRTFQRNFRLLASKNATHRNGNEPKIRVGRDYSLSDGEGDEIMVGIHGRRLQGRGYHRRAGGNKTTGSGIPSFSCYTVAGRPLTLGNSWHSIRNHTVAAFGGGPQGVDGRVPRMFYGYGDEFPRETPQVPQKSLMGLTLTDPYHLYLSLTSLGTLQKDEYQLRAMKQLQKLYHRIIDYLPPEEMLVRLSLLLRELELQQILIENRHVSHRRFIHNLFRKDPAAEKKQLVKYLTDEEELIDYPSPQGLLIYGEVGCGKSMLMDIFASSLPHKSKMRWHFNNFILWVYTEMHQIQQERLFTATFTNGQGKLSLTMENEFILFEIAQKMISRNTILMLDEFMMPDIASANIIKILFTYYFKLGGVLVATSNKLPEELYASEFHKASFKSFVAVLNAQCQSVDMRSTKDYRTTLASDSESYLVVKQDNSEHDGEWMQLVRRTVLGMDESHEAVRGEWPLEKLGSVPGKFSVYNRLVTLPMTWKDKEQSVVYLNFSEICKGLHSSSDYITLASKYRTVVLDGVPVMTTKMKNEARRFITLLDAIYESKCRFFMRSDADVDFLFFPDAAYADQPEILKKLALDENDVTRLEVQDEEMFAKTAIAMSNPYRPNVSTYDQSHTETYDDYEKNKKVDFTNASAFTGEDEKFAYKRAVLRIKEMVNTESWRRQDRWVPIDATMRPWEKLSVKPMKDPVLGNPLLGITDAHSEIPNTTPELKTSPKIQGDHHFWAMGPWTNLQGRRLKDSIAKSWLVLSMRSRET